MDPSKPLMIPHEGSITFQIPYETYREVPQFVKYLLDRNRPYYLVSIRLGKLNDTLVRDYFSRAKLITADRNRTNNKIKDEIDWALLDFGDGDFLVFNGDNLTFYTYNFDWAYKFGQELYEKYHKNEDIQEPHFRLISRQGNDYTAEAINIRQTYAKTDEELLTHYSDDILKYREELFTHIQHAQSGIHILLGDPGVGKTSFLRYTVGHFSTRQGTKFYFVPPAYYGELGSTGLLDFFRHEREEFSEDEEFDESQLILILEDSEALLRPRNTTNAFTVSELLNVSDGLLGEGIELQFLCTINCPLRELDEAIIRPGRLLSSHQFLPLPFTKAYNLAKLLNRELVGERRGGYTLAEIYHSKVQVNNQVKVGF